MAAAEIPRGPIYRLKSGSRDETDNYAKKILDWKETLYEKALSNLRDNIEYDSIGTYINLLEGRHWRRDRPEYRSRIRDNRIAQARLESLSYLTDIRPTIDVYSKFHVYDKVAEVALKCIQSEWQRLSLDLALIELVDHAMFGTGYWKIGAFIPGAFTVLPCGIDMVIPIQEGKNIQDSSAILYRVFHPPQYFKAAWPNKSDGIEREAKPYGMGQSAQQYVRPWNVNEYTWRSMSPQMKYHLNRRGRAAPSAVDTNEAFPMIELQEFWVDDYHINESSQDILIQDPDKALDAHNYHYIVKPGQRLYPRKRVVSFGGDRRMYDGPSPYWDGKYPFAKLCLNPVVWAANGLSAYRDLVPLNQGVNDILAGVMDTVKKAINQQIVARDGAVRRSSWEKFYGDMPGAKLEMTPAGDPQKDVRFIDPPQLPGYVMQVLQYLVSAFREHSGQLDMGAIKGKKQLPGADTIEQMKSAMTTPFRLQSKYLEAFLEQAGMLAVPKVFQHFTLERRMRLLGPDGRTPVDFDFAPKELRPFDVPQENVADMFPIQVAQGSLHGASKDRDRQVAIALAARHQISLAELYRRLDISNGKSIMAEMVEEAKMMPQPAPKGRNAMTGGHKRGEPF